MSTFRLTISRNELLKPLFDNCSEALPCDFNDWEIIPGYVNKVHVATAILKGNEIHFGIKKEHRKRLIQRKRTREYLKPLLDRKVFLTTRIVLQDQHKQKFVERIGFKKTWADDLFNYYMMTKLPFEKENNAK